jgi:hypothetical protein
VHAITDVAPDTSPGYLDAQIASPVERVREASVPLMRALGTEQRRTVRPDPE